MVQKPCCSNLHGNISFFAVTLCQVHGTKLHCCHLQWEYKLLFMLHNYRITQISLMIVLNTLLVSSLALQRIPWQQMKEQTFHTLPEAFNILHND
jgi:hypothetical protein